MHPLYRYVGPPSVAEAVRSHPRGTPVRSGADLRAAHARFASDTEVTCTFVVDHEGVLRVADRASEHVACAGGAPVFAAGELTFDSEEITEATNQSTGYCPPPACWEALARALQHAHIAGPPTWTARFEFRRCTACGARSIVKDEVFECPECGNELPRAWNFERTRVRRGFFHEWIVDVAEEASRTTRTSERSQARSVIGDSLPVRGGLGIDLPEETPVAGDDRVHVAMGDALQVALADGAGGSSGGAEAATRAVETVGDAAALRALDHSIASSFGGRCTAIWLTLSRSGIVHGLSVGDSEAWCQRGDDWRELTENQQRKPLVGSGKARPVEFAAAADLVLVASDGLTRYAKDIRGILSRPNAAWNLVGAARLPSGGLQDDIAIVLVRRRASGRGER
ncbi:MAG: hypothetical protein AAGE52_15170 [Myxococcota bacterium]